MLVYQEGTLSGHSQFRLDLLNTHAFSQVGVLNVLGRALHLSCPPSAEPEASLLQHCPVCSFELAPSWLTHT